MSNFPKNVEDATEQELLNWINNLNPNYTKLASDELTRRGIKNLNKSIDKNTLQAKEFNSASEKSSRIMERFTVALFVLALVQILIAIFQLILSFVYPDNNKAKVVLGFAMVISTAFILIFFSRKVFKE
jgi:hypothetical protein